MAIWNPKYVERKRSQLVESVPSTSAVAATRRHASTALGALAICWSLAGCSAAGNSTTPNTAAKPSTLAASGDVGASAKGASKGGKGDDNHVPEYGFEASPGDRKGISAVVTAYFAAAAKRDGKAACAKLYSPLANSVVEDYGQSPGPAYARGTTCAAVLVKVFSHVARPLSALLVRSIDGARVEKNIGFAEFRSQAWPSGAIAVEREGSGWRIGALIPKSRVE